VAVNLRTHGIFFFSFHKKSTPMEKIAVLDLVKEARASAQAVAMHVGPVSSRFQTALDALKDFEEKST
jgi:hypothetical protein